MIFQSVFPRNKFKKCSHQVDSPLGHTPSHYHPIKKIAAITIQAVSQFCCLFSALDFHSRLISLVFISLACTQIFPWLPCLFKQTALWVSWPWPCLLPTMQNTPHISYSQEVLAQAGTPSRNTFWTTGTSIPSCPGGVTRSFRKLNLKCTKLFHLGPNLFSQTLFVTELTLSGQDFNLIKGYLHLKNNFNWTENKEENSAPLKSISFQVYLEIQFWSGLGLCVLSFKNYWMALGNKRNWALFLGRQHSSFKPFHDPTCESVPTFGCLLLHFSPRLLHLHLWWTQHIQIMSQAGPKLCSSGM